MKAQIFTDTETGSIQAASILPQQPREKSSCLLLGFNALNMLVPRALVAEVIKHSFIELKQDGISGMKTFDWRGCQVPMLQGDLPGQSAEVGTSNDAELDEETRVIIFYGLRDTRKLPFYAMTVTKSPQLLQVSEEDLEENVESALHPAELMKIVVNGSEAFIPKIDYFENTMLEILQLHEQRA